MKQQESTIDILAALKRLRRSKDAYLKILRLASSSPDGITAREVEKTTKKTPQAVNPILRRMIKRQLLTRKLCNKDSRYKEFQYFLHPSIDKNAIAAVIGIKEAQQESPDKLEKFWLGPSNWVRPGVWGKKYLKTLLIVAQAEQVAATEIVQKLEEKPQAVNRRLRKMAEQQFLDRVKYGQEFYYSLGPTISKEAIKSVISAIAPDLTVEISALIDHEEKAQIPPLISRKEIVQMQLSKVPIFDPEWAPDFQENWFKVIAELTT